ncbi:MAG TPA: hypothetical protein VK096_00415 [Actinomycetales bacterium]|nr:hypothetical protein [Actinomycetales bacterium]
MRPEKEEARLRARGRPDYHDPTAGLGGAAPAYSALTLRIVLASLGVLFGIAIAVIGLVVFDQIVVLIAGLALTVVAIINLIVVLRRKARGEPG